ncbi:MAG TPA: FG-GAP-like repeat-containing protein [Verrucomicrobiae bacterium]|nr:FG-GAP-like repeat-containing protein [Verrucomicrobiae bacterium]
MLSDRHADCNGSLRPPPSAMARGRLGGYRPTRWPLWTSFVWCGLLCGPVLDCAEGQLITNLLRLQNLVYELPAGDPKGSDVTVGPKAIAATDFDGDGAVDLAVSLTASTVNVFFGQRGAQGQGNGRFEPAVNLAAGSGSLRGIVCADLNGDYHPDIAVAAPFTDRVVVFYYATNRQFAAPVFLQAWHGVRNLVAGDFDGDGATDLVGAGPNLGLRWWRGHGTNALTPFQDLDVANVPTTDLADFPKPVYSMESFRPPRARGAQLVLTHADTNVFWTLGVGTNGLLQVTSVRTNKAAAHAVEVAPLLAPAATGLPDLVTVFRDAGSIEIREGKTNGLSAFSFGSSVAQHIDIPGGPRAIAAVDVDGNGWNDLVVVQRNFDSVLTYTNSNGSFELAAEHPVGSSPRELVVAKLDGDPYPDLAVLNRDSANISILTAAPRQVAYRGVNHLYLVDGYVAGLIVQDFNGDGYGDVIQLHRASGDFSVRLANPDGSLQPPVFYTVGNLPSAQVLVDVNKDGIRDHVSSSLGVAGVESGSVSVRLGNGDGTFGDEKVYHLPTGVQGRLLSMVPADLDGDGNIDLVVGFLDSNLALFQGDGSGGFAPPRIYPFVEQARGLATGDFDQDGDIDLAGVGVNGEIWVVENTNHIFTSSQLLIHQLDAPPGASGARTILAVDVNGDGDLDLVVGGKGAWVYLGGPGMSFGPPTRLSGTDELISDLVITDLDNNQDGNKDMILSCRQNDCLSFYTVHPNGQAQINLPVDAPSSRYLAVGDLDGDGLPDLVGTGRVLWTALSGHQPLETNSPLRQLGQRAGITNVVINEFLASSNDDPLRADDGFHEWIELYNGLSNGVALAGWRVELTDESVPPAHTNQFVFEPPAGYVPTQSYVVLYCSPNTNESQYHTGWKLPVEGATLRLRNAAGVVIDEVRYPSQRPNVSYARYRDGLRAFVFNPFPTPGRPNPDNGLLAPEVKFLGVDPGLFQSNRVARILASARDDVGVSSLTLHYQRLDENTVPGALLMRDDGLHGDGAPTDGTFGVDLDSLPQRGEFQFYFEVTDLNDLNLAIPDEPVFGIPGSLIGNAYGLSFTSGRAGIELSEVVADNRSYLKDPKDGTNAPPDWVEIRNTSSVPVTLGGLSLAQQIGDGPRYQFPNLLLQPGQPFVVFCDNQPEKGTNHAPFSLKRLGETVMLTDSTTNQSRTLLDWVSFGSLQPDEAYARMGAGGRWRRGIPTPLSANVAGSWVGWVETNDAAPVFNLAFPTARGALYTTEHAPGLNSAAPTLNPEAWQPLATNSGSGIEQVISLPIQSSGFFRVRKEAK